ncbi:hypothetical protein BHE74_00054250 [Ensete ventricosum]|nr:hypothetical protein BHE74_00054250 [Ensete ventricosum]
MRGRSGRCYYLRRRQEWQVLHLKYWKRVAAMVEAYEASIALVRNPAGTEEKNDLTTLEEGVDAATWRGECRWRGSSRSWSRRGKQR